MRRLIVIFVWTVVYFSVAYIKIRSTWGMSIFKLKQWMKLFREWRSGQWVVDTTNEYTLCAILLLLIPIWLIVSLVIWCLLRPKFSAPHVAQTTSASQPFIPAYTPVSMPSQGKSAVLETPPPTTSGDTNTDSDTADKQNPP